MKRVIVQGVFSLGLAVLSALGFAFFGALLGPLQLIAPPRVWGAIGGVIGLWSGWVMGAEHLAKRALKAKVRQVTQGTISESALPKSDSDLIDILCYHEDHAVTARTAKVLGKRTNPAYITLLTMSLASHGTRGVHWLIESLRHSDKILALVTLLRMQRCTVDASVRERAESAAVEVASRLSKPLRQWAREMEESGFRRGSEGRAEYDDLVARLEQLDRGTVEQVYWKPEALFPAASKEATELEYWRQSYDLISTAVHAVENVLTQPVAHR